MPHVSATRVGCHRSCMPTKACFRASSADDRQPTLLPNRLRDAVHQRKASPLAGISVRRAGHAMVARQAGGAAFGRHRAGFAAAAAADASCLHRRAIQQADVCRVLQRAVQPFVLNCNACGASVRERAADDAVCRSNKRRQGCLDPETVNRVGDYRWTCMLLS